jgi:hypothetical protein
MTLSDRLMKPYSHPALGWRNELSPEVEEALVQCLKMCSEFQFPMKKKVTCRTSIRPTAWKMTSVQGGKTLGLASSGFAILSAGGATGLRSKSLKHQAEQSAGGPE